VEKIGYIEIKIVGKHGNIELSPDNYDIKDIVTILDNAEKLLFPNHKKERPLITYDIQEGSVKHILKTSIQAIISINALFLEINNKNSIDFLEYQSATAIETIQINAIKRNFDFEISTSIEKTNILKINPQTNLMRTQNIWVDAELYYYGQIINAGGKITSNIHLSTDSGILTIDTPKDFLEMYDKNLLYKNYGIRVSGKQNIETKEVDKNTLKFLELIDYFPSFNELYINKLIKQAKSNWIGIDPDEWLRELRGKI